MENCCSLHVASPLCVSVSVSLPIRFWGPPNENGTKSVAIHDPRKPLSAKWNYGSVCGIGSAVFTRCNGPHAKTAPYGADTGKKPSKSIPLETRRAWRINAILREG